MTVPDLETGRIEYGRDIIEFTVTRAATTRKTVSVRPDGSVTVRVPEDTDFGDLENLMHRRAKWIVSRRREFAALRTHRGSKRYVSGETHRYLGRQYRLKVREAGDPSVKLRGGFFVVKTAMPNDPAVVKAGFESWLRGRARVVLTALVEDHLRDPALRAAHVPRISVRKMKARWGSCTAEGRLSFNLCLIQMPKRCVEYVVVHELCHLIHHNHGRQFYRTLSRVLPDWRERRERLNKSVF